MIVGGLAMRGTDATPAPSFDGACPPSPGLARFYPILRPKPGSPVIGVAVNDRVYGVWCHFHDNRTSFCYGDAQDCQGCYEELGKRWYGFLPLLLPTAGRIGLVQLTSQAVQAPEWCCPPRDGWRCLMVKVERVGQSKRGRIVVRLDELKCEFPGLPRPIDVAKVLETIMGQENRRRAAREVPHEKA